MDLQLSGRIAVVTGASKGIGLATTRTLLDEGARVVAVSRQPTAELDALASENLAHVAADLMGPDAPAHVIARTVEVFGGLDILVNNAGGPPPGVKLPRFGFLTPTDADWLTMFEFNLFSAVRAIRAAIPVMLAGGGGAIVNVSTGMARQPAPMNVDYAAAKAGINNITKALSEEFAPQGIRVNTVSPGPVRTAWWTEEGGAADIIAAQAGTGSARSLGLDLAGLSDFERAVLAATRRIPAGETRPYGWIAREAGRPGAVRAAGSAPGRNPVPLLIPCHRVVRADGGIGDYIFGTSHKDELLRAENVNIEEVRDLAGQGVRFLASDTTGVVCFPTCHNARRITATHRHGFAKIVAALEAGYRPCRHCRPSARR